MDRIVELSNAGQLRTAITRSAAAHANLDEARRAAVEADVELARWFADWLKSVYRRWEPAVGDTVVRLIFVGARPEVRPLRVLEVQGRRIRLGENHNAKSGIGLSLDYFKSGLPVDGEEDPSLEFLIPQDAFNSELRLLLDLPRV